jgi:hypothetical protein
VESSGIPFQSVARMRPWMIANVLIVQAMAQQGFPVEQGLELYFLSEAEKQHKRVSEPETAAYRVVRSARRAATAGRPARNAVRPRRWLGWTEFAEMRDMTS